MSMTRGQQKHLLMRLQQITQSKKMVTTSEKPVAYEKARELIRRYDQDSYSAQQARAQEIDKAKNILLDTIMFSDSTEVLEQLKAFEARQF